MPAIDELAQHDRIALRRAFSGNARFYAPKDLTSKLGAIATAQPLAVIVEVDTLDRSMLARGDRVMTLALEALSEMGAQVVIVSREPSPRSVAVHRSVARSWCMNTRGAVDQVRSRVPASCLIAIADDADLLDALGPTDCGITLAGSKRASNVMSTSDAAVRALLWWLVDVRCKAGLARA